MPVFEILSTDHLQGTYTNGDDDAAILNILPFGQFGISHYLISPLDLPLYYKPPSPEAFDQTETAKTAETAKTIVMANLPCLKISFHLLNLSPYVTETPETAKIKELHYHLDGVQSARISTGDEHGSAISTFQNN